MTPGIKNILLIQLGDIGDVVLTTPTVRAAKETYPEARISVMVRKPFGELLAVDPHISEVLESERVRGTPLHKLREHTRFAMRLRKAHYDLVIDLRTGTRGAFMSFLTRAPMRVGRHCQRPFYHDMLFTKLIRDVVAAPLPVHPGADQSLRIVRAIGIETSNSTPRLHLSTTDIARAAKLLAECGLKPGSRLVTINPFSRWKYKEWDEGKWGQVIDWLWEAHGIPSVLVGSKDEAATARRIVDSRESHAFNLAGKTTLGELAAVIATSTLHMGVDSAASHIAAAVGTPTVTIHGPTDWRAWRTCDDRHRVVCPQMDCVPCHQKGCDDTGVSECLEKFDKEPVIEAVNYLLKKISQCDICKDISSKSRQKDWNQP